MNIDQDLERIALQEKRLQFKSFDSGVAWALGNALKAAAEKRHVAVAIDIQVNGHALFSYAMAGTTPDNWEWIRRKRNVVMRYRRSSYAIGLKHQRAGTTLERAADLMARTTRHTAAAFRFCWREQDAWARSRFRVCRSVRTMRWWFRCFRNICI